MDILTHAAVGYASTGSVWGAVGAVLPDMGLLSIRRQYRPTYAYLYLHSMMVFVAWFAATWWWSLMIAPELFCFMVGWFSHIVLDIPTHGERFAVRPMFPASQKKWVFEEWEWFNRPWWIGLGIGVLFVWMSTLLRQ